jgi:hypothetical protein
MLVWARELTTRQLVLADYLPLPYFRRSPVPVHLALLTKIDSRMSLRELCGRLRASVRLAD